MFERPGQPGSTTGPPRARAPPTGWGPAANLKGVAAAADDSEWACTRRRAGPGTENEKLSGPSDSTGRGLPGPARASASAAPVPVPARKRPLGPAPGRAPHFARIPSQRHSVHMTVAGSESLAISEDFRVVAPLPGGRPVQTFTEADGGRSGPLSLGRV